MEIPVPNPKPEAFPAKSPEARPGQPAHEVEPGEHDAPEIHPAESPDATPEPGPDRELPAA